MNFPVVLKVWIQLMFQKCLDEKCLWFVNDVLFYMCVWCSLTYDSHLRAYVHKLPEKKHFLARPVADLQIYQFTYILFPLVLCLNALVHLGLWKVIFEYRNVCVYVCVNRHICIHVSYMYRVSMYLCMLVPICSLHVLNHC